MTDLIALAERVEALTGPEYRMEIEIENALGLAVFVRDPKVGYGDADYGRRPPKPFTASLDAAMTLVPDGWAVERSGWHNLGGQPDARFKLVEYRQHRDGNWWHGGTDHEAEARAATPALALTAAALRARAAMETTDDE